MSKWWIAFLAAGAAPFSHAADLEGVVTSAKGPEAGVWVIAETTDLPTKFAKIVVTDDRQVRVFRYPPQRGKPVRSVETECRLQREKS